MVRKLLIVFASGMVLAVVTLGGAWILGGKQLQNGVWYDGKAWHIDYDTNAVQGPQHTRTFPVTPGQQLAVDVPAELTFVRGDKAQMVITGPSALVNKLVWSKGRLSAPGLHSLPPGLKVTITAPQIAGLDMEAPGDVTLSGMDQNEFHLTSNGAIDLNASGRVDRMFVTSNGAGSIDLEGVKSQDAVIRLSGAGSVTVGARNLVDVVINGVGSVDLVRKPITLRTQINGLGSVNHSY